MKDSFISWNTMITMAVVLETKHIQKLLWNMTMLLSFDLFSSFKSCNQWTKY